MRKFKVKVNGKEYEVEIEEIVSDPEEEKNSDESKKENPDTDEEKTENVSEKA